MKTKNNVAFSLVEVVLAMGILSICMVLLMGLLPVGLKTNEISAEESNALNLMTAIGVLTVLGALIAQVISATSRGSHSSNQIVDSSGQARLVLDRLGVDLGEYAKAQ